MPKYYGNVGYVSLAETKPGVYEEQVVLRKYYGEIIRNSRSLQSANQVNDNINISFEISIVSDPYANQNFHSIRFVEYMGSQWKVVNASPQYPRIVLSVGGLYNNGKQT